MSRSDTANPPADVSRKFAEVGHYSNRACMGVPGGHYVGSGLGGRGQAGIKWRCAECVARATK